MVDNTNRIKKLTSEDAEELEEDGSYIPSQGTTALKVIWLKAFYSPAAGQWIHVDDSVFIGTSIAKVRRIIKQGDQVMLTLIFYL